MRSMDFKKGFTLNLWNVSISLAGTAIVWFLIRKNTEGLCGALSIVPLYCPSTAPVRILLRPICACYTWNVFLTELLVAIIIPFIVIYTIISLIQSREKQ